MNSKPISSFPLAVAVYLLVLGSGCNADVNQPEASSTEAFSNGFTLNGFSLNGFTLNGFTLNGFTLNGFTLNGFSLNGFSLNGFTLNGAALSGTLFSASTNLRPSVSGAELIGALAQISVQAAGEPQPAQYTLRFDNIYVDPNNPGGDVYLYDITYVRSGEPAPHRLAIDFGAVPVHDAHTAMAELRIWRAPAGTTRTVFVVGGRRLWRIDVTYAGEETVSATLGSRRAVRFDGKSYRATRALGVETDKPARTFSVWLSDDADRVPLKVVARTELGDVVIDLTEYARP